jgi:uncharacterized delta-60 repeat protein
LSSTFDAGKFTNGQVSASVLQPADGKLLIAGSFAKVNGVARKNIARLNPDGTLDLSFDPGVGPDSDINGMILQPDGKILIFGFFSTISGVARNASAARLNSDGSLDASFDPGSVLALDTSDTITPGTPDNPGFVSAIVLQSDNKIVVTGSFFFAFTGAHATVPRSCVARFNSDGTFDATFNPGAGLNLVATPTSTSGNYAARQSNDKIIVEGAFDQYDGNNVPGLVRLNANGSYDGTFLPGTAVSTNNVAGLFVQADDAIVVYGNFLTFSSVSRNSMVRLDKTTGGVDTGFNTQSFKDYADTGTIQGMSQQSNGKLIVTGAFHSLNGATSNGIARLNTDGTRDATLDASSGSGPNGYTFGTAYRPSDGAIFVGGYFSTFAGSNRNNIALIKTDGSLDTGFAPGEGVTDGFPQILALATQPDGKVLVGGIFTSVAGVPHYNFVRLNTNGTVDPTFDVTLGTSRSVRRMELQPDGKILIAGQFGAINGSPRGRVARLNADGTIDPSFDPGTGANDIVYGLARDASGNVYIGGAFTSVNGTPRARLAKLSSTGALDMTFDPGTGPGGAVGALWDVRALAAPTNTAGLVVGGFFTTYQGVSANRIFRCDAGTAARDTGFNFSGATPGTSFNSAVRNIASQSDGKYMATGNFTTYNGTARSRVARLNVDGTLDTTFTRAPAVNGTGFALAFQNTKIYVGGTFPGANAIGRLSSTGAADPLFVTGTGPTITPSSALSSIPQVNAATVAPDGKLLIGGTFTQYNGATRYCLARLTDSRYRLTLVSRLPNLHMSLAGFGPPSSQVVILSSPDLIPSNFTTLATVPTDAQGAFTYDDAGAALVNSRYYELAAP